MVSENPSELLWLYQNISFVSVALLVFDHCLTLDKEFKFIWLNSAERRTNKFFFWFHRYGTEVLLLYSAYNRVGLGLRSAKEYVPSYHDFDATPNNLYPELQPATTPFFTRIPLHSCNNYVWASLIGGFLFTMSSQFVVNLKMYALWDHRKLIGWILSMFFVCFVTSAFVFIILSGMNLHGRMEYNSFVRVCTYPKPSIVFTLFFGVVALFDLFCILFLTINAISQPRRANSDMVDTLKRDGAKLFLFLFAVRLAAFIIAATGRPLACLALIPFLWSISAVVTARLQLKFGGLLLSSEGTKEDDYDLRSRWSNF